MPKYLVQTLAFSSISGSSASSGFFTPNENPPLEDSRSPPETSTENKEEPEITNQKVPGDVECDEKFTFSKITPLRNTVKFHVDLETKCGQYKKIVLLRGNVTPICETSPTNNKCEESGDFSSNQFYGAQVYYVGKIGEVRRSVLDIDFAEKLGKCSSDEDVKILWRPEFRDPSPDSGSKHCASVGGNWGDFPVNFIECLRTLRNFTVFPGTECSACYARYVKCAERIERERVPTCQCTDRVFPSRMDNQHPKCYKLCFPASCRYHFYKCSGLQMYSVLDYGRMQ